MPVEHFQDSSQSCALGSSQSWATGALTRAESQSHQTTTKSSSGDCKDLSDVQAFLGMVGVAWAFIRNFGHRAWPLVRLRQKGAVFEWQEKQQVAQDDLKEAILASPALRPIDYSSNKEVALVVDTSYIAMGYPLT